MINRDSAVSGDNEIISTGYNCLVLDLSGDRGDSNVKKLSNLIVIWPNCRIK